MIKPSERSEKALVLSSSPYSEDSALVTLAGKEGLFSLLVRGIYKPSSPFKPLLITGNVVSVDYRHRNTGLNTASSLQVDFDASVALASYSSSCFLQFLEEMSLALYRYGDSYPYEEVETLIAALIHGGDPLSLALLLLASFYRSLGLKIETKECVLCQKSQNIVSYSLEEGGFLCEDCAEKLSVPSRPKEELYLLKFAFSSFTPEILAKKVPKASGKRVLLELIEHLLSYFDLGKLRSLPLFLEAVK